MNALDRTLDLADPQPSGPGGTAFERLRLRLGVRWFTVLCLLPPTAFGVGWFGPRAGLVVGLSVALCVAANVATRALSGERWRWVHPSTVITGLLLGLTMSVGTPVYMIVVGALVAELAGKQALPGLGRHLLNPAALGRGAVALLEVLDPPAFADATSSPSPLFKDAGGHAPPAWADMLLGTHRGAIGETSAILLVGVGLFMLGAVVLKRHAALAMLVTAPIVVALAPGSAAIAGHAPWVLDPMVYMVGSATLLTAIFFATDPVTTPDTRAGAILFGVGAATLGVLGRLHTAIPGCEMWGVLVMNALTPGLDWAVRRAAGLTPWLRAAPSAAPPSALLGARSFYIRRNEAGRVLSVEGPALDGLPEGEGYDRVRTLIEGDARSLVEAIAASGLGGCGGAHFPVARKWASALAHPGPRVLLVNAQEGEPGSLKDRALLQHRPRRVIEGAALTAIVLEATLVIVVVDPAFGEGRRALEHAAEELRAALPARPFELRVVRGPGLYICGEETALISFLEGKRAEPTLRPPFPTEQGLLGRPTVVHNAETMAWVSRIAEVGALAWRADGVPKLVTITGAVHAPGVQIARLGEPIAALVARAGGVVGEPVAMVVGGPGGGIVPWDGGALRLDRAELDAAGAALGTASIKILGQGECPVAEALGTARFFEDASCGRCTPCRVGTARMTGFWTDVTVGHADEAVLARVREVATTLHLASSCGLGTGAPNHVISVLRHWPDHVAEHLAHGRCPQCPSSS